MPGTCLRGHLRAGSSGNTSPPAAARSLDGPPMTGAVRRQFEFPEPGGVGDVSSQPLWFVLRHLGQDVFGPFEWDRLVWRVAVLHAAFRRGLRRRCVFHWVPALPPG